MQLRVPPDVAVQDVNMVMELEALSFALSIYLQTHDPSANFFLPFSRAWELGLGALIALNDRPWRGYFAARPALRQASRSPLGHPCRWWRSW